MGYSLDLENPKTFNEKLQWLKLYDRNPKYTMMVDKYLAKEYVANLIGKEYIIPTLRVWDSSEEIDFDALPNHFVLKCNHNSGTGIYICKDKSKLDINQVKKELKKGLKENFYLCGREWPYKDVQRKIIAEEYIGEEEQNKGLDDYRVYCFNGEAKLIYMYQCNSIEDGRKPSISNCDIFDINWNLQPFHQKSLNSTDLPKAPKYLNKMIELSEKLSKGTAFLRVDFYEINDRLYVGELTFYPGSGFSPFYPVEWDLKLGQLINIKGRKDI